MTQVEIQKPIFFYWWEKFDPEESVVATRAGLWNYY